MMLWVLAACVGGSSPTLVDERCATLRARLAARGCAEELAGIRCVGERCATWLVSASRTCFERPSGWEVDHVGGVIETRLVDGIGPTPGSQLRVVGPVGTIPSGNFTLADITSERMGWHTCQTPHDPRAVR